MGNNYRFDFSSRLLIIILTISLQSFPSSLDERLRETSRISCYVLRVCDVWNKLFLVFVQ